MLFQRSSTMTCFKVKFIFIILFMMVTKVTNSHTHKHTHTYKQIYIKDTVTLKTEYFSIFFFLNKLAYDFFYALLFPKKIL